MRWMLGLALAASACATPANDTTLRIASWNMEHLAEANGSGCKPRTDADYTAMRVFAQNLDADVIAFQEVESAAAATRVFDATHYQIVIEERAGSGGRLECRGLPGQFLNRQATGFAIRHGVSFNRNPDFVELQVSNPDLRSGVDITLRGRRGQTLRLLSVHLKSGCASGQTNEACPEFLRQTPVLERWIDARVANGEAFAVLGDFNRRLAAPQDAVWVDWNDNEPQGADLVWASGAAAPRCDPRYNQFIDHIVLTRRLTERTTQFREWTYSGERVSDHCPISIEWAR